MTALRAVVALPFRAFDADSVSAAKVRCSFSAAVLAQLAVGTYHGTVFTFTAFIAEFCTVGAVFAAVIANIFRAVGAVITIDAHTVGTVNADSAVGTEFIYTAGAFSAVIAYAFGTIGTDGTALLTDLRTVSALIAILAEHTVGALYASIAGYAHLVTAGGANLTTVLAKIGAVFASFSAGADHFYAGYAKRTLRAEIFLSHAVLTEAAVNTKVLGRTFAADFVTFGADRINTFRAASAADTYKFRAHLTGFAVIAEVAVAACTVLAYITSAADLIGCTFGAFFIAFGADIVNTFRASCTADTYKFRAHLTGFAVIAEVAVAAGTVLTDITSAADCRLVTVGAFFETFGADAGAVGAAVSAVADIIYAVLADTAFGAVIAFTAHALKAYTALGADLIIGAGFAFFTAFGTDNGTVGAAASAYTDKLHAVFALAAFGAVVALAAYTVEAGAAFAAEHIIGAVFAFLTALGTDDCTIRAALTAEAYVVYMIFTNETFMTEVVVTTGTVVAYSALHTDVSVRTVFAVFAALGTNICTFRAARTASTDNIHAVLT